MLKFAKIACVAVILGFSPSWIAAQVPEIPTPGLPDIARVIMTPSGPVIQYNPIICAQMGPLACSFMRKHEYGHIVLGHAFGAFPPVAEMQADCWAAQNASAAELQAAIQAFQMQGMGGSPQHGTGFQRAQRIYDAAQGNCHW